MDVEIFIIREAGSWPEIDAFIESAARTALRMADYEAQSEVSFVLADDAFVRDLNHRYRGKDKPTNVLSFPQDDEGAGLGDVIFALETIRREAEEQGKAFEDHLAHLTVHGTLHLLGYDHENDDEAEDMEALEVKILAQLGIANPYE